MKHFSKYDAPQAVNVQVEMDKIPSGLIGQDPTFMVRLHFPGMASKTDELLFCILELNMRKRWDKDLTDHYQVGFVVNRNLVVIEQEADCMVSGYDQRECILKRFYWKENGRFYVYQSSVPDEIFPDADGHEEDAVRFDFVHMTMCFSRVGDNVILEKIYQVDFRRIHSPSVIDEYA